MNMQSSSRQSPTHACDLMVIGAGMAGMAATLFAVNRGLRVVQAGGLGGIDFTTGLLDVLGARPLAGEPAAASVDRPWEGLERLRLEEPHHPYTYVGQGTIQESLQEFTTFLANAGLPYKGHDLKNTAVLTAMGTRKMSYRLPLSMWAGAQAMAEDAPALFVDFPGLKGCSGRQIVAMQAASARRGQPAWSNLRAVRLPFPGRTGELYPEHLAWALEDEAVVAQLADAVAPHIGDAVAVGFPAVLGLYAPPQHAPGPHGLLHVMAALEARLGRPVFEIPTLPPSMAGVRLRAAFETQLPLRSATMLSQKRVVNWQRMGTGELLLQVAGAGEETGNGGHGIEATVQAKAVLLAGGRFFGGGLQADRHGVMEPLFRLPVHQPPSRDGWHREDFFDGRGHPLNRAGLEVDACMRPLDATGKAALQNCFAAGAILAHQDWMRERSGAGLAIATAFAAVREACAQVGDTSVDNGFCMPRLTAEAGGAVSRATAQER